MRSQRIDEIEAYIFEHKTVTIDCLCEKFHVSKNTIRRDLDEITAKGDIKKIYGGVTVASKKELLSFDERNIKNLEAKQKIAMLAAETVEDGDIIFIDSGTTTIHMVESIKSKKNITILTNNLEVILRAIPYPEINIISLSGTLDRKTLSFSGTSSAGVLQTYNISKAFMATTGISIENGVTNSSPMEYDIKRIAVRRSNQVYLLADSGKFNLVSLMTYCDLDQINALVTDKTPPRAIVDYFKVNNIQLLTPPAAPVKK